MFVLLDESGDHGVSKGSFPDPWFCIAAVLVSRDNGPAVDEAFDGLRAAHGEREFHFTDDSDAVRRSVLAAISALDFHYYGIGCNKSLLKQPTWKKPRVLYREVTERLLMKIDFPPTCLHVQFDTLGGKRTDNEHATFLRKNIRDKKLHTHGVKTKSVDSSKSNLAQVADYVCGAFGRSLRTAEPSGSVFRSIIQSKETGVVMWPQKKDGP